MTGRELYGQVRRRLVALGQWLVYGALVGAGAGVASALFLAALDRATRFREAHEAIVYLLPVAGLVVGALYARWGAAIRGGNNLVLDTVHGLHDEIAPTPPAPGAAPSPVPPQIPLRMVPMVLVGTVLTHLFGGSAGREGTAVQMGASLADAFGRILRVDGATRRRLLAAGMAGGFGSVFGTPVAGMIFGLEVVTVGRIEYDALAPALVAAVVGDVVTRRLGLLLGVAHTVYPRAEPVPLDGPVALKLAVLAFGLAFASVAFVEVTHRLKRFLERRIVRLPLRMFAGGAAVVAMWKIAGTDDYLGLGVPTIVRAFTDPQLSPFAWAAKLLFTAVTLASGFLGGEVTPLFFVGATMGSAMARGIGLPIALGAGVGLAAVFGAAANTPLALSIMAVELLGTAILPHVLLVTVMAYLLAGHRGIYTAQRIFRRKHGGSRFVPVALRDPPPDE